MKGKVIQIAGHSKSEEQAKKAKRTLEDFGWDIEIENGITPDTLFEVYPLMKNGRLTSFKQENPKRYQTKVSCVMNQINFWKDVYESGEVMGFFEHDAICYRRIDFDAIRKEIKDYIFLAMENAFDPPAVLAGKAKFLPPNKKGVRDFDSHYNLRYKRNAQYKGAMITPGAVGYILSPTGAEKLLKALNDYGLEQGDMMLNSQTLDMQYLMPSCIKYNTSLRTSHGF